jgi:hypothetical protein
MWMPMTLPEMTDPRLVAAVRVLNGVSKAAYQVRPELCVAVATKAVNLCLKHGNTPDCAIGHPLLRRSHRQLPVTQPRRNVRWEIRAQVSESGSVDRHSDLLACLP